MEYSYNQMMAQEVVIKPKTGLADLALAELWNYRELFYIFAWRDIKIRYKQTLLGIIWVLFQPLVTTGIFSIFFGKIAKIPSNDLPYPLFVLTGLVIWNFFANGVSSSSQSLVSNQSILQKVYFPRLIIPISAIVTTGIDFVITLIVLLIACLFYGYFPNPLIFILFPVLLVILLLIISGLGMFTAALNVKYRDVRYVLPFFIQTGLFVTPVIYPLSIIYDYRKWLLMLNPLTGIIETFRVLVTGRGVVDYSLVLVSLFISILIFSFGLFYFRKTEYYFADVA